LSANDALHVAGLEVRYGDVRAVSGVDFAVQRGSITTLIGSNGAGKTSVMRAVSGLQPVAAGRITHDGKDITGRSADYIVRSGISLVPEGRRLFPTMTVRENLELGAYLRSDAAAVRRDLDRILDYFPPLSERLDSKALNLSGGQQQMVAIGRALMSAPRLLLLDEPTIGLAPAVVQKIGEIIRAISESGVDILLVEQNAHLALRLSRYAYVIENGSIALHGSADELQRSEAVREAYLGL
jgi:branched-chain amino acid transport system ATP-binding protein